MATFERMLLARKHVIIAERYNVIRKIGGGSFGDIFLAININDGEVKTDFIILYRFRVSGALSCVKVVHARCILNFTLENGGLGVFSSQRRTKYPYTQHTSYDCAWVYVIRTDPVSLYK